MRLITISPRILLILGTITVITATCKKKTDSCTSEQFEQVYSFSNPPTASVGQNTDIAVTYSIANGCGQFEGFEDEINGTARTVRVKARYEGCMCTEIFGFLQATYTFNTSIAGIHIIKFQGGNGDYINDTLLVQ